MMIRDSVAAFVFQIVLFYIYIFICAVIKSVSKELVSDAACSCVFH